MTARYRIGRLFGRWAWIEREGCTGGYIVPADLAVTTVLDLNCGVAEPPQWAKLSANPGTLLGWPIIPMCPEDGEPNDP